MRDRIVSPEEFERLKKGLPQYALMLALGYYTGMREGEILNLKEGQIHFMTTERMKVALSSMMG